VSNDAELERLLAIAQKLFSLTRPDDVLAASCTSMLAWMGAHRAFASWRNPIQPWESGHHVVVDASGAGACGPAARSALFAVHRALAHARTEIEIARDEATRAIFDGLGCEPSVATIHAMPIVHRSGRLWGGFVLVGAPTLDRNAIDVREIGRDQSRLLLLAEATDDAFYDYALDTRKLWWGGGILKLHGSETEPAEHTARWKLDRIHPDDSVGVRESFAAACDSTAMRWQAEYRFRRHDGTYIGIEDRCYFLRDEHGRAYRVVGSMRDVTAMNDALACAQQARAEAEAASRAKDDFLAILGHELRNPLAPIISGLELVRLRGSLDVDKDLPVLQRQSQYLIRLVDDLLDASRIAHGKVELKHERLELRTVVASAIESVRLLIESRMHALTSPSPTTGSRWSATARGWSRWCRIC
jgi:PAS domain-containing protein